MREIQTIVDVTMILLLWVIGIVCIPVMKKIQPEGYKAYAIYVLAVCLIFTVFAVLYLCQR